MTIDSTKVFKVLGERQLDLHMEEVKGPEAQALTEAVIPYPRNHRDQMTVDPLALVESGGELATSNFPDLLRQGVKFDVFSAYGEPAVSYPTWTNVVSSNKQQEEYLRDSGIGMLPVVNEGEPYPEAATNLDGGTIIKNYKRGFVLPVTEEMQMFDQLGKVRDMAQQMGRAARLTEEQAAFDVLTTTANYTRNSTTDDNDEGANQQTLTFTADALNVAFNCLRTMKDRKTGQYLGVNPDTLIVTPLMYVYVAQLLRSAELQRAHGATSAEVVGTGTVNPFFNVVRNIIVSPYLGSEYEWALLESKRAIQFQRVKPIEVLREAMNAATGQYFERDVIRFRIRTWFGVGMKDDRYAFYSDSSTKPTIS